MSRYINKDKVKYLFYTFSHPMDGFYWIRRKNRGSVVLAVIMVLMFGISFSLNRYLASFVVNNVNERDVNIVTELIGISILYILICTANWSVTCLMNGEGRFKDIIIAVGYSALPMNMTIIPATIYSQFVAKNEEVFYLMIIGIGIAWAAVMAVIGIMQIHGFSLGKTLVTIFLTFVALFIILFLMLLLYDLINQMYNFAHSIYLELLLRS